MAVCPPGHVSLRIGMRGWGCASPTASLTVPFPKLETRPRGEGGTGLGWGVTAPGSSDGSSSGSLCPGRGRSCLPPPRPPSGPGRAGAVLPPIGAGAGTGSGAAAKPGAALPPAAAMAEGSEKVPIARAGPDDVEQCLPPVSAAGRRGAAGGTGREGTGPSGSGSGWD